MGTRYRTPASRLCVFPHVRRASGSLIADSTASPFAVITKRGMFTAVRGARGVIPDGRTIITVHPTVGPCSSSFLASFSPRLPSKFDTRER